MGIRHISAVTLFVDDMARSCAFYRALGFELKFGGDAAGFSSFRAGGSFLNLNAGERPRPGGGLTIFHVDDVDAQHARATSAGLEPDFAPKDAPWGERYFHIYDPDGYLLSFATPLSEYRGREAPDGCIGIDGCRAGWIAASRSGVVVDDDLGRLLDRLKPDFVAVDMPIGLAERDPRGCDIVARRLLGPRRGTSVFPTPVRSALAATSHTEAGDLNAARSGRRISVQAWNLLPKIREVDTLLRTSRHWRERVFEVHPEVSFAAMNEGPAIAERKREPSGKRRRQALLAHYFGTHAFAAARSAVTRRIAGDDDIADALACLFTAERIAHGQHVSLPDVPEWDRHGLPMRICY